MMDINNALISVRDKTGLSDLVETLRNNEVEIIATLGTAEFLQDDGFTVTTVSEYTGQEEMLGGRVKTLDQRIYAGILARRDVEEDMKELNDNDIKPIDLVVCNLYPFGEQLQKNPEDMQKLLEMIDIGGVSMLRAAAKNYYHVSVLSDPEQYPEFIEAVKSDGLNQSLREKWARKAFATTACYDGEIFSGLPGCNGKTESMGDFNLLAGKKIKDLKYGENPHQKAALYQKINGQKNQQQTNLLDARQLNGEELSYNNMKDAAAALQVILDFPDRPAAVIIKHTNPCGLAEANSPVVAFRRAYAGDPQSAYGGIAGFNCEIDESAAKEMGGGRKFLEVVVAPKFTEKAEEILCERWNDIKLLETGDFVANESDCVISTLPGGFLKQENDSRLVGEDDLELVVGDELDEDEIDELLFAWKAVKHVKSNAIVLARDDAVVGVGAGQMSRIDALHLAGKKASGKQRGGVLASDAFFPFADAVQEASDLGIKTIIQPGGSIRDGEVKSACKKHDIKMVFTGVRHFLH